VTNGSGHDGKLIDAASDAERSIPAVFEQVVRQHGPRTALVGESWRPSYDELNAIANRLAHAILARGGALGDRVAILMAHDAPAIAAVVAVTKSGRIVVVLDPTHPPARLRELMADSEPALIITDTSLRDLAKVISGPRCTVIGFEDQIGHGPDHNPKIAATTEQVIVLAYTSGSTGRPKAIMITHRKIWRTVAIHTEAMQYSAVDRLALLGSLSGGQGITTTWSALLNGAALCPFPVAVKGLAGLADWMTRHEISIYTSSASIFRSFMKTLGRDLEFSGVRAVRLASESATSDDFKLFQAHFPDHCWLVHMLTSTEAPSISWSRWMRHDKVFEGRLSVGAISQGEEVLILDTDGNPVAAGEVGEIVVRSRYLAAGYWRDPEATAQRFSADLDGLGTRLFRTGDLGRFNAAGCWSSAVAETTA
jgi:non-ribosomal peptide synthetase component F